MSRENEQIIKKCPDTLGDQNANMKEIKRLENIKIGRLENEIKILKKAGDKCEIEQGGKWDKGVGKSLNSLNIEIKKLESQLRAIKEESEKREDN